MSSSESRPSLQSVCMCRSPRICSCASSVGSSRRAAASIASVPSRSSGGTGARSSAVYRSASDPSRRMRPALSRSASGVNVRPRVAARSRNSNTCVAEPVSVTSRATNASGRTMRMVSSARSNRSTTRSRATWSAVETKGSPSSRATVLAGSAEAPSTSRSPVMAANRRKLPVGAICSTSGHASRMLLRIGCSRSQARPRDTRVRVACARADRRARARQQDWVESADDIWRGKPIEQLA